MQRDMHYYGTYAMAAAAGIPKEDAEIVAHASQNVDDQNDEDIISVRQDEGDPCEAVVSIPTAHHPLQTGVDAEVSRLGREVCGLVRRGTDHKAGRDDSRMVWVPFHFLPGASGKTYLEKLVCRKDSEIAREMLEQHLTLAADDVGLVLAGIAAHVYADTFAHFGFSGVTSWLNCIEAGSVCVSDEHGEETRAYIEGSAAHFQAFYGWIENVARIGHGSVDTCPDRPFLKWSFRYKDGEIEQRSNPDNYLDACRQLHAFFARFAGARYADATRAQVIPFDRIEPEVRRLIAHEGKRDEREDAWVAALGSGALEVAECRRYVEHEWTGELISALEARDFTRIRSSHAYLFHSAAEHHRHFVLKRLLPKHGLIVA
ncbi:DUF6765 family protein [Burkholderia guangdongensis]|uniref:DUF6765 family protein n=1 Tax=Burkholderia guangdongensis TaxID=1792500 RepID=UPI0015CAF911|nr:DUF6765 family protein [Burkholderia guangdongensis]